MNLVVRNLLFSLIVPGLGAVAGPAWMLTSSRPAPTPTTWSALIVIAAGLALYLACVRVFAVVGRDTPGPWDPPRQVVTVGPYRCVRNPIYLAPSWSCSVRHGCSARGL
jgi:protein-S-isoprenylcysteine O-methyltransferase Ste14